MGDTCDLLIVPHYPYALHAPTVQIVLVENAIGSGEHVSTLTWPCAEGCGSELEMTLVVALNIMHCPRFDLLSHTPASCTLSRQPRHPALMPGMV